MNILALDTSSRAVSCAILRGGALAGEFYMNIGLIHSQTAMPMIEKLFEQTMMTPGDIDVFAVSTGPGSFTGLRIGISCVKGMAMAANKPCAGVSTLLALAGGVRIFEGYICPVMDARREQVYTSLFESNGNQLQRLREDEALSLSELREVLIRLSAPVMLVGDGTNICYDALSDLSHVRISPEHFLHQRASAIASIAHEMALQGSLVSAGDLSPSYLRLSQAERERHDK